MHLKDILEKKKDEKNASENMGTEKEKYIRQHCETVKGMTQNVLRPSTEATYKLKWQKRCFEIYGSRKRLKKPKEITGRRKGTIFHVRKSPFPGGGGVTKRIGAQSASLRQDP